MPQLGMDLLFHIPPYTYSIAFVALLLLTLIYIFWDEHQLRMMIDDVRPDRQVDFLMRKFRYRSITLLVILALMFGSLSYLVDELRRKLEIIQAKALSDAVTQSTHKRHTPDAPLPVTEPAPLVPADNDNDQNSDTSGSLSDDDAVLNLFEPAGSAIENQSLDGIKKRYENALIGSYILHHCKRTSEDEMTVLLRALRDDIINFQNNNRKIQLDPKELYASIVSAAEGSFQIGYNRTQCDTAEIDMLEQQYAHFIMQYKAEHSSGVKN